MEREDKGKKKRWSEEREGDEHAKVEGRTTDGGSDGMRLEGPEFPGSGSET